MEKILSIDEFIDSLKNPKQAKPIKEETQKLIPPKKPVDIKAGDVVEDRYGNKFEVTEVTTDFEKADAVDDWDQISKFKDKEDITYVIVWSNETKTKKLVYVIGSDDDMSVRKLITKSIEKSDLHTDIFKNACARLEDSQELSAFKSKWRKFIDKVRTGKITNDRHIMMEILDDFNLTDLVTKKTVETKLLEKIELGDTLDVNVYELVIDGKSYYINPKNNETETSVYVDRTCETPLKDGDKTKTVKIKPIFGVDNYIYDATSTEEPT